MSLNDDLERIAALAAAFAEPGESVVGILAAEPARGDRVYLCAFVKADGARSWLALDDEGRAVEDRAVVRDAVSIAAMCELAGETAGGGELEELRAQLVSLRITENPEGIDEAEEAALSLEETVGAPPRVASPAYLDAVGAASKRLERALGAETGSPFAAAMQAGTAAVEVLAGEVERAYKRPLA